MRAISHNTLSNFAMTLRTLPHLCSALALAATALLAATPAASQTQAPPTAGVGPDAAGAPRTGPRPIRKDRVFVKDVEGLWIARDYVDALRATRMPLAAARKAAPLTVHVKKAGNGYQITRTDFTRAVLMKVIEVEPGRKDGEFRLVLAERDDGPVSADQVTYLPLRGQKNEQGRFDTLAVTDPVFSKKRARPLVRVEEGLGPLLNGIAIAGDYVDGEGRAYAFTAAGEAILPDGKWRYELALAPVAGSCEVIESAEDETAAQPKKHLGFAWKAGRLQLFQVSDAGQQRLQCAAQPFATLQPKVAGST